MIITNLIERYDRLMEFGKKHLNDLFAMEGIQRVSARDKILREIISNLLMHRDFFSGYVPKLLIERDKITVENANLVHGHGTLNLNTFKPFSKNPPIAKIFREIGLADELGSGMKNSYKYTRLYSGGEPVFREADIFTIVVPLQVAATVTVGPTTQDTTQDATQVTTHAVPMEIEKRLNALVGFCGHPRTKHEMMEHIGLVNTNHFRKTYLVPLLESGRIEMTIPDKPRSKNQKYVKK